jgi:hypothetical protein
MTCGRRLTAIGLALLAAAPITPGHTQTRQRTSIQLSAIYQHVSGDIARLTEAGRGFEAQLRVTPGQWSIGGGIDAIWHEQGIAIPSPFVPSISVSTLFIGGFLEPRFVLPVTGRRVAPYLSGRLGIARARRNETQGASTTDETSTGYTANAGGGVLIRVARRLNFDAGATMGLLKWTAMSGDDGAPQDVTGTDVIVRLGASVGIGR